MRKRVIAVSLPSREEINPFPEDLDGQRAVRNFFGKTREQIAEEFQQNSLSYTEDLMWMGSRAFCYYLPAAVDYLVYHDREGDGSCVNALLSTIEFRLESDRAEIKDAFNEIRRFARAALARYDQYDLPSSIYGDIRQKLESLLEGL